MPDRITAPGIYPGFNVDAYFEDPCPEPSLTQSVAKILLERSPAHARLEHPRLAPPEAAEDEEPEKYIAARAIGNAAHLAMIGRGKDIVECTATSWRSDVAKKMRATAEEEGMVPILSKHLARARAMIAAASYQLEAVGHPDAFRKGNGEVVLAWQEDGLWLRCMVDWMVDTTRIYDLKSTAMSVAPHVVAERPSLEGWDIQAAMIDRGLNVLDPDHAGRRAFYFVNQENAPPYALTLVQISRADLTLGHKKLEMAVDIWRDCITRNAWPAYPAETVLSVPRPWTETRFLEREEAHAERRTAPVRKREPMLTDLSGG